MFSPRLLCIATFLATGASCVDEPGDGAGDTTQGTGSDSGAGSSSGDPADSTGAVDSSDDTGSSDTGDPPPIGTEVECWTTAFEDAGAQCMRVPVLIDPEDPDRGELEIGVVYLAATGEGSGHPIVALVGGPGPSGTQQATGLFLDGGPFAASRDEHDAYIVDYRAVGFSEPFAQCAPPNSPPDASTCATALTATGLELEDVTSARFAADVDEVLERFGVEQAILWGGSYGTRLGMTIMRDFPGRVAAAVLDGVFPIEINGFTQGGDAVASQLAFVADRCADDPGCTTALGDTRAQIEGFVADRPTALVDAYITEVSRLNRHGAAPLLVATLDAATDQDAESLLDILATYDYEELGDADYGTPLRDDIGQRGESFPMTLAIVCAEEAAFIRQQPPQVGMFGWSEAVVATFDGQDGGAPFPPEVATLLCDAFGAPAASDLEIMPVESDIPTLIISGGQDVQTPTFWADDVATGLPNATHHVIPLGTHVAATTNGCGRDMVTAFFDAPTDPVDASCLSQYPTEIILTSDDLAAEFSPR